jgi:hypothetical protein
MTITLIDLAEAGERLDVGEQAYEYQTDNKALRILGRLQKKGLYAETLDEAITHARTKNAALTGVWFVKR